MLHSQAVEKTLPSSRVVDPSSRNLISEGDTGNYITLRQASGNRTGSQAACL